MPSARPAAARACSGDEPACAFDTVEARTGPHPERERPLRRAANYGPVGEGVREREAELDEIRSTFDRRRGELGRLRPGHEVDDELLHASSATRAKSVASTRRPPCRR